MNYKLEGVMPYKINERKGVQIEKMFDVIAFQYDSMNTVISLGMNMWWRKKALKKLRKYKIDNLLDIGTGTGDFAIQASSILKPRKIIGVDISKRMMDVGREKVEKAGLEKVISFDHQDCSTMTFPNESFDATVVSFGVRNFEDIDSCFKQILRVLKPGGVFMFLELTTPRYQPVKFFYKLYSKTIVPSIVRLLSRDKSAYGYLPESIKAFPQGEEMKGILKKNGFETVDSCKLTLGVCTIYIAVKAT